MKTYRKLIKPYLARSRKRKNSLQPLGFHGDQYLLALVDFILQRCDYFVETGADVGSTLAYVARTYPNIQCLSCEPNIDAFSQATQNTALHTNVTIYGETSQKFIKRLTQFKGILEGEVLFWLDAHGHGFEWPLRDELNFITNNFTRAFVLIDDFLVPELDCFGYDEYLGQVCSFDYVKNSLNSELTYRLYYPNYTDRTSKHHPLRGWGLIEFGHEQEINLPKSIANKMKQAR